MKEKYMEKAIAWGNKKAIVSTETIAKHATKLNRCVSKLRNEKTPRKGAFITYVGTAPSFKIALKKVTEKKQIIKEIVLRFLASIQTGKTASVSF